MRSRRWAVSAVLAGFPQDKDEPREDADGNPSPITNAGIAYSMDKGMPEQNVPARPFMIPGIESVQDKIVGGMETTGLAALDGDSPGRRGRSECGRVDRAEGHPDEDPRWTVCAARRIDIACPSPHGRVHRARPRRRNSTHARQATRQASIMRVR